MDWRLPNTILQGVLLGGLYAMFAAGLSLIFGVMRLVNIAHGDLIVLGAFILLAISASLGLDPFLAALVSPSRSCSSSALRFRQVLPEPHARPRSAAAAAGHLRSVDHHPERAVADLLRRQPAACAQAPSRRLRSRSADGVAIGRGAACSRWLSAVAVIVLLNLMFYRTPLGRAFRATSDDLEVAQLMGIDLDAHLRRRHGPRLRRDRDRGALSRACAPISIRPSAGAADLCVRSRDHRRAGQLVGHAGAAASSWASPRPSARDRSGMADPGRPYRLPGWCSCCGRAACSHARRGLSATMRWRLPRAAKTDAGPFRIEAVRRTRARDGGGASSIVVLLFGAGAAAGLRRPQSRSRT